MELYLYDLPNQPKTFCLYQVSHRKKNIRKIKKKSTVICLVVFRIYQTSKIIYKTKSIEFIDIKKQAT